MSATLHIILNSIYHILMVKTIKQRIQQIARDLLPLCNSRKGLHIGREKPDQLCYDEQMRYGRKKG